LIDLCQLRIQLRDDPAQLGQRLLCSLRHVGSRNLSQQRLDLRNTFRRNDTRWRKS